MQAQLKEFGDKQAQRKLVVAGAIAIGMVLMLFFGLRGGGEKASWATQEAARQQAIDNAQINANSFRNAYYSNLVVMMRGDSTISAECPQGDGWATVDLAVPNNLQGNKLKIKCSTVSASIGCMTEEDFKSRPQYANQDGHCNAELPFPLPKIGK